MSDEKCISVQTGLILASEEKATLSTKTTEIQKVIYQFQKAEKTKITRMKQFIRGRLHILDWIGDYNTEWAVNDLIAGMTLGLTIIPESIACALLAGLPARYGLCSAFIGSFVYLVFGSIHKVIIGPTSLVALVSVQFTVNKPIEFAFLLTFLSGIIQIIMGCLRMGFIFEFISMPVIKAFSSATAVLVIESQIKVLFGIKYLVAGLLESVQTLSSRMHEANLGDLIMGMCAIAFLVIFDQLEKLSHNSNLPQVVRVCCRYLSFSRNTLIVFITAIITYFWLEEGKSVPFALSQNALSGLPNFTLPRFTVETPEKIYSLWDVLAELNIGIIVIPIVGILTNISIGKLTPKGLVNSDQELFTVGLCNIFGSCVQSMPTSGAFSRYAISTACGLKTPMANLYSGIIVLLALSYISPYFNYIPEATLAAILMCSIYTLLDFKLPRLLWRESKRDFTVWLLCFLVCIFFGVEVGLFVSIIVTILHLLFLWARPEIAVKIEKINILGKTLPKETVDSRVLDLYETQYVSIIPGNGIYFPAINFFREKVLKACLRVEFEIPVVIDCIKVTGLDFTAAQGILRLSKDLQTENKNYQCHGVYPLILYRLQTNFKKLIVPSENLIICDSEEKLHSQIIKIEQQNRNEKILKTKSNSHENNCTIDLR